MKYMGSKNRIAKYLLPIILKNRKENQYYVEPFVGGANMIDKVDGLRIGADNNEYLISMWKSLQLGWIPPTNLTKDDYNEIKNNKESYGNDIVGWVGFNVSYCGKFFGGYAGEVNTKDGVRNYQIESIKNVSKQIDKLTDVSFVHSSYQDLQITPNSIIYCDPPYQGTTGYKDGFDHEEFWNWCREKSMEGHEVYVSEYNAPDDFECIWTKSLKSSLSANGSTGNNKTSVEKLFIYKK